MNRSAPSSKAPSTSQQRAVEEKRLRGELSCAECRRLKLKCDRAVPCSSCTRRGCASICPSGVLEAGAAHVHQGGMRVGQLRTKIGIMAGRIRELEAALGEGHALLDERLLRIGRVDEEPLEEPGSIPQLEGLGTLTLGEDGEASYFGSSGGNESLIAREMMNSVEDDSDDTSTTSLDPMSELFTAVAGPSDPNEPSVLPPEDEARRLAIAYCSTGAVFFRAWTRSDVMNEVLPKVYGPGGASAHMQSALFFSFALGAYLNPQTSDGQHEIDAELWFKRGRIAFQSPNNKRNSPEDTIRSLGLMGTYFSMASRHHSRDSAWTAFGLASKLCQGQVYAGDVSHSIALGRPSTTPLSFVDCEYPDGTDDNDLLNICTIKYKYAKEAFLPIMDLVLAAHPLKRAYRDVLELDAKIRRLQAPLPQSSNALKMFYASQLLNAVILTLHRSYMARAIVKMNDSVAAESDSEKPFDPFDVNQTPYAPSVAAAYHASQEISRALHGFVALEPEIAGRLILGALASRAPGSPYAPSALMTLSLVVDGVFAKYADMSPRHRTAFVILRKLKTRSIRRYTAFLEAKAGLNKDDNGATEGLDTTAATTASSVGLGPGAVDPNDPTLFINPDEDPESDSEDNQVRYSTEPGGSIPGCVKPNSFEGRIAMFGGSTVVLNSKGKKKSKSKRKNLIDGAFASSPESASAASPESTTSTASSSKVPGTPTAPGLSTLNPSSMDVFMSDILDPSLDRMEGVENFNLDAFGFGYDNFGTDAGSGIVMGMALEDIGIGGPDGFASSSSSAPGPSNLSSYNANGMQAHKDQLLNPFSAFGQQYRGGFPLRTSLSPEAPSPPSSQSLPTQKPKSDSVLQTATAQAARMFGMGVHPFVSPDPNASTTDLGQSFASSSNGYANLNLFDAYGKQQQPAQQNSFPPFLQQQQSSTSNNSPSTSNPLSTARILTPPSLASSSSPSTSGSPAAFIDDPAQLYARFTEFMAQKGGLPLLQQQQASSSMMNQMPQQPQHQNQQGYASTNTNSYNNYGGGFSGDPNGYQNLPRFEPLDSEVNAFLNSLRSVSGAPAGTGMGAAGSGQVLPYGQVYGERQQQQQWNARS
ncbi:hypothetical protein BDP27DRAFT_1318225 [Rhodocollybia butyracea]|uniref:Zn(2)-C6 fungal-type domain-containing protein n=1 Tax=Rhodocollybia butyracea TaxID=206335 RepID=A0A9P5PWJ5_9AGAR|nr:hypothetical protein BDP27DRAFT_1318225 [Rhodocollybia butyracea]